MASQCTYTMFVDFLFLEFGIMHILFLFAGNVLARKLSSAGSLGSMEESHFLQASLNSFDSVFSERRGSGEAIMSPYFLKSMTPSAFEAALRQKDGELASYVSRLVNIFVLLFFHSQYKFSLGTLSPGFPRWQVDHCIAISRVSHLRETFRYKLRKT